MANKQEPIHYAALCLNDSPDGAGWLIHDDSLEVVTAAASEWAADNPDTPVIVVPVLAVFNPKPAG